MKVIYRVTMRVIFEDNEVQNSVCDNFTQTTREPLPHSSESILKVYFNFNYKFKGII